MKILAALAIVALVAALLEAALSGIAILLEPPW